MPDAALRNAVPRAMPLPQDVSQGVFLLHTVAADEWDGFRLKQKTDWMSSLHSYWLLHFSNRDKELGISFQFDAGRHGMPIRRYAAVRTLFTLQSGEIGSFHINGRFSDEDGWLYEHSFINFAWVDQADADLFVARKADYCVDDTADLF